MVIARLLTGENGQKITTVIGEESCFYLLVKETFAWKYIWYRKEKMWVKAEREENRYRLPGDIFTYLIHEKIQTAEGTTCISFTNGTVPDYADLRELSIHLVTA